MPTVQMKEDVWNPSQIAAHRQWRAKMYDQKPVAVIEPVPLPDEVDMIAGKVCPVFGVTPQQMLESVGDDAATGALLSVAGLAIRRGAFSRQAIAIRLGVVDEVVKRATSFVDRVFCECALTNRADLVLVAGQLKDTWEQRDRRVRVADIISAVAIASGLSRADITSSRRTKDVVLPRHVAMALSKALTSRSLPDIGRSFGGRDHTTVLHALVKIAPTIEIVARAGLDRNLDAIARQAMDLAEAGHIDRKYRRAETALRVHRKKN